MPKLDLSEYRSKIAIVFLTIHKTLTHKLFHSPRSFCIVTTCVGGHTNNGKTIIFYELDYHYCHYYDLWQPRTRGSFRAFVSILVSEDYPGTGGRFWWRIWFYRHEVSNSCQGMVSICRHKHFVDMKILYLQQDVRRTKSLTVILGKCS